MKKFKFIEKNGVLKVMSFLLVCSLIAISIMFSTFSKFTSTRQGTDSGSLANFDYTITVTNGGVGEPPITLNPDTPTTIDLFNTTINDSGVSGYDDTTDNKLLAPGMNGCFRFTFTNEGDVVIRSVFENFNYINSNSADTKIPIIYYFNGYYYSDIYSTDIGIIDTTTYKGNKFTYYFNQGEASANNGAGQNGITLRGDMTTLQTDVNEYYTNTDDKGAAILNVKDEAGASSSIEIGWFWPYEARAITATSPSLQLEEGVKDNENDPSPTYIFDKYNIALKNNLTTSIKWSPKLEAVQIDNYGTITPTPFSISNSGSYHWYGTKDKETNILAKWLPPAK